MSPDPHHPHAHSRSPHWHPITLAQLQRVKDWREAQRGAHPVECQIWEAILTVWLMGWMGWLPAYAFEAVWAYPLCVLGILAPRLYVYMRAKAHVSGHLRCDWLELVA
ncbi:hypothetical protein SAMN05216350_106174 [Polaromonas sp. YR568]|uniref:hypothetical protein n=1 Tax=Polaromonas sp. YR568 TaxID=1855301 RepID=UPI0008EE8033|nr:hypothetical protein [Polaromonas sp. YR568]SFU85022.1 hypothetical protein SAMN05216350_106174 [Polaromonas sp. YR568]